MKFKRLFLFALALVSAAAHAGTMSLIGITETLYTGGSNATWSSSYGRNITGKTVSVTAGAVESSASGNIFGIFSTSWLTFEVQVLFTPAYPGELPPGHLFEWEIKADGFSGINVSGPPRTGSYDVEGVFVPDFSVPGKSFVETLDTINFHHEVDDTPYNEVIGGATWVWNAGLGGWVGTGGGEIRVRTQCTGSGIPFVTWGSGLLHEMTLKKVGGQTIP